jgi:dTDP-4-amino-4,6-dideoxygalactose transaminase
MKVPFIDLESQYLSKKQSIDRAIMSSIYGFNAIRGKEVGDFESAFAKKFNISHAISTGNGTDALFIALKALGVQPGDEVLTPAFSCIPSSEVISLCHAKPVFVDIDPETYTLDHRLIQEKVTSRTKAIIVVHLFGQMAHVSEIASVCQKHNLFLVEDCAQAHLSAEEGKFAGTFGDAGAFSFYPTKNLGAYGDAGCIVTKDADLAVQMRRFANHGALEKDDHLIEGMNSRMDTIQASILLTKINFLDEWNKERRANAALYDSLLVEIDEITTPTARPHTVHTFHIYAIRAQKRDELKGFLQDKGIQTIVHYPKALPNLPAYRYMNHNPLDFPVASRVQDEILSLPIYPELTDQQIHYVCTVIKDFYGHN